MLALTNTAAEVVEAIVQQPDSPEGAVLRISTTESETDDGEEARDLHLAVAEPQETDVRVDGIAISVEPEALEFLDDKVLDAEVEDDGVRFRLYLQPEEVAESAEVLDSPNGSGPVADAGEQPSDEGPAA